MVGGGDVRALLMLMRPKKGRLRLRLRLRLRGCLIPESIMSRSWDMRVTDDWDSLLWGWSRARCCIFDRERLTSLMSASLVWLIRVNRQRAVEAMRAA